MSDLTRQPPGEEPASEPFRLGDWRGEVRPELRPADLAGAIEGLLAAAASAPVVFRGRNLLYRASWPAPGGARTVVAKSFATGGWRRRLDRRLRASRAERSWRAARALLAAGVPTPEPVLWVETAAATGPALFVSDDLGNLLEARLPLRQINAGGPSDPPREELLAALAALARRLHGAGLWHRDFSAGNVLLERRPGHPLATWLVDVNRTRRPRRLSLAHRLRDLCRMPLARQEDQRLLLAVYFGRPARRHEWWLYRLFHRLFHGRHRLKGRLRGRR